MTIDVEQSVFGGNNFRCVLTFMLLLSLKLCEFPFDFLLLQVRLRLSWLQDTDHSEY